MFVVMIFKLSEAVRNSFAQGPEPQCQVRVAYPSAPFLPGEDAE